MNDQIKYPDAPVFTVNVKVILLEWEAFDKFQRGYTGSNCSGLYLSNTEKNEYVVVVPKPKTPYVMGWSETERLLGHEIRHVIREQNPGIEHPDPDRIKGTIITKEELTRMLQIAKER